MASKKSLKKSAKEIVYEVLDSCDYHIVNDTKSADAADKLMDEAVDFHEIMVARISAANSRKEFSDIAAEVTKMTRAFKEKLNGLG